MGQIIGKLLGKFWYIIVIILLIVIMYFMYNRLENLQDESNRRYDNLMQVVKNDNEKLLTMNKKEFKDFRKYLNDTLYNEIVDSLNLKVKNIERTINHKYTHIYDTTIFMKYTSDSTVRTFDIKFDPCVSVYGKVDWKLNDISLDSVPINYNATSIYHWKRPNKFWFIKWGRKQNFVTSKNNCNGKTTIQEINIEKK